MSTPKHIAIVAHAKSRLTETHIEILKSCDLIIAADGGAESLLNHRLSPQIIVGDLDGISKPTLEKFRSSAKIISFPKDKDHTDLELAVNEAQKLMATQVSIFCWADERIDFSFGILVTLRDINIPLSLYIESGIVKILNQNQPRIEIPHPSIVSVYSLSEDCTLQSSGLKWPLDWKPSQPSIKFSQSNETLSPAKIELSKGAGFCLQMN